VTCSTCEKQQQKRVVSVSDGVKDTRLKVKAKVKDSTLKAKAKNEDPGGRGIVLEDCNIGFS